MKKLSKDEMKKVIGGMSGSGPLGPCTLSGCYTNADCFGGGKCKTIDCVWDNGIHDTYKMCVAPGS